MTEIYYRLPSSEKELNFILDDLGSDASLVESMDRDQMTAVILKRCKTGALDQDEVEGMEFIRLYHKARAYQYAETVTRETQNKIYVDNWAAVLRANPDDQEAVDALQKAINIGSPYAKAILDEILNGPSHLSVVGPDSA